MELVEKVELKARLENELQFSVASQTQEGLSYLVSINRDGQMICECPGFTYRKKCAHIKAVLEWIEKHNPEFEELKPPTHLPTGIRALDELLDGGLPLRMITQLVGPPRVNKTPMALQISSQYPTIFITTEYDAPGPLTNKWISEFAKRFNREPKIRWKYIPDIMDLFGYFGAKAELEYSEKGKAELVLVERIWDLANTPIGSDIKDIGAKLIVIDSLSAPLKESFIGRVNFPSRSSAASIFLGALRRAGERCDLSALTISHETRDPANPYKEPDAYGSYAIDYNVKYCVYLDRYEGRKRELRDIRYLWLERHPNKPEWEYKRTLEITDSGFYDKEGAEE